MQITRPMLGGSEEDGELGAFHQELPEIFQNFAKTP